MTQGSDAQNILYERGITIIVINRTTNIIRATALLLLYCIILYSYIYMLLTSLYFFNSSGGKL